MTWPVAVLLVIACGVLALWWLCRCLARQDADEAHRNLARLVAEQIPVGAAPSPRIPVPNIRPGGGPPTVTVTRGSGALAANLAASIRPEGGPPTGSEAP